ncbi:virulence RhuM family protein [Lacinutrix gracilariae]|uniref:Virulence RhuM family protein n=1 Tax=Lacinutrix gracilariae TaxID=1747198 RepID=A0ABW5JZT7_9FLAO
MSSKLIPQESNFLLYTTPEGEVKLQVLINNETVWLTQKAMQDLFDRAKSTISEHITNVFKEGELQEDQVVRKFRTTANDGKDYETTFYNLDVIISVGYRVKSHRGTQFRIWATKTLREYIIKGFVLDDERLKQGKTLFGKDYFKELLERVRSIRASERRIYQQVTDIFAECSIDYDKNSSITKKFYATVQNKFHYAITGKTAAEIIYLKADSKKPTMGLKTWKNAPEGRILKSDTNIAKNYLEEKEIKQLERTVTSYFDYIEGLIERENTFTMEGLANSVNKFLEFNEYKVLDGLGKKSKKQAENKAFKEYDTFNKRQSIESDFDKMVKKLNQKKNK